jgi:PAS domain S-box-containing protein
MGSKSRSSISAIDGFSEPLDRLRAALDASCVVGTWHWDIVRGTMVYDAGAARLLTGDASLAEQEVVGLDAIATVHPADHKWLAEQVMAAVPAGGLMLAEFRVITEDGTVHWLLSRGRTSRDDVGRPMHARGILIDITEMREGGERYVLSGPATLEGPLDRAADLAIAMKRTFDDNTPSEVRAATDVLLFTLGRAIARATDQHGSAGSTPIFQ